jgi:hypothetical protein
MKVSQGAPSAHFAVKFLLNSRTRRHLMNINPIPIEKKIFVRLSRVVWILIAVLAIAGAPLNPGPVQAQSPQIVAQSEAAGEPKADSLAVVPWRDEFNGSLAAAWSWTNENATAWNLTDAAGFLRIYASPLGTGAENLLLRSVAAGDFVIETRLLFEPDADFQFAGLVVYQDADNFLQFGRAFCDVPDGPAWATAFISTRYWMRV